MTVFVHTQEAVMVLGGLGEAFLLLMVGGKVLRAALVCHSPAYPAR